MLNSVPLDPLCNTIPFFSQNPVRWQGPKDAPNDVTEDVPELLDELMNVFLPPGLSANQRLSEKNVIFSFIRDLNQVGAMAYIQESKTEKSHFSS